MENKDQINTIIQHTESYKKLILSYLSTNKLEPIEKDIILQELSEIYKQIISQTEFVAEQQKQEPTPITQPEPQTHPKVKSQPHPEEKPPLASEPEKSSKIKSVSDLYTDTGKSLNENMAIKNVMDLASKIKAKPISDIPAAIGINDKFQYIKELFNGDTNLYTQTIRRLNEAGDLDAAYTIITQDFNWDLDNEFAQNLISLVHRKYAPLS